MGTSLPLHQSPLELNVKYPDTCVNMNEELRSIVGRLFIPTPPLPENFIKFFTRLALQHAEHHRMIAKKYLYDAKPRQLDFGFLHGDSLNAVAYATKVDETPSFDFIGINHGAPTTLLTTFFNMLARRDIFPQVGDIDLELEEVLPADYLSSNVIRQGIHINEPQCPVRRVFAEELMNIAFDFLYFHELAHLKNGHLEVWRQNSNAIAIVEVSNVKDLPCHSLRRTLEAHADRGGVEGALYELHNKHLGLAKYKDEAPAEYYQGRLALCESVTSTTLSTIFAIYVVFRLFHEDYADPVRQSTEPYPRPDVRFCSILKATLSHHAHFSRSEQHSEGLFEMQIVQTAVNAEIACSAIWGGEVDAKLLIGAALKELPIFEAEFNETWTKIRPSLDKYKRGSILDAMRL